MLSDAGPWNAPDESPFERLGEMPIGEAGKKISIQREFKPNWMERVVHQIKLK